MSEMTYSHIVACDKNNVIGSGGTMPWDIPEDFKFFKDKTSGHIIIMGRKTFESLPNSKPLPNRLNIIITRQKDYKPEGTVVVDSVEKALEYAKTQVDQYDPEIFICGGGEIYKQTLDLADTIYLTRIYEEFNGDTLYPEFDESKYELVEENPRFKNPVDFTFFTYRKKSS